jgi:SAM-dependent methyltransferase
VISWLTKVLLSVVSRPGRRMDVSGGSVRLNVGGGIEVAEGWINVDGGIHALLSRAPSPLLRLAYRRTGTVRRIVSEDQYVTRLRSNRFIFHDLTANLPFDSETVDYIFCSHLLEHLSKEDGSALLREMFRVLRPDGRIRITVPDLALAVAHYQSGEKEEALRYFFPETSGGQLDSHRTMYDFPLLEAALHGAGFRDVTRCGFLEGKVPDLARLDNRPNETLFVEASKPGA